MWTNYAAEQIPSTTSVPVEVLEGCTDVHTVIDLGCGTGKGLAVASSLGAHRLVGLDINFQVMKLARVNWKAQVIPSFVNSNATDLPFKDSVFDLAIAQAFLTVIPSLVERHLIINEVRRVLRPGAFLYVGEFLQAHDNEFYERRYSDGVTLTGEFGTFPVWGDDGEIEYLAHHFSYEELSKLLEMAGLEIIETRTLPMMTHSGNKIDGVALVAQCPT